MNEIDSLSVSCIRLLAADAIEKAKSGHPGMPIGAAPIAYALWRRMGTELHRQQYQHIRR